MRTTAPSTNPFLCLIVLALLLASTPSARAQSITLIDTFGPNNTYSFADSYPNFFPGKYAARISVPAGGVTITSVSMAVAVSGPVTTPQISVWADCATGRPAGNPLVSAPMNGMTNTITYRAFPFTATTLLPGPAFYWVGINIAGGSGAVIWEGGLVGTTQVSYFDGVEWLPQSLASPLSLRVIATAAGAPCCNARGTGGCMILTPAECNTVGGIAGALGGTCAAANCATSVPGACCNGPACVLRTQTACATATGRFLGAGNSCTPVSPGGPSPCCPADFNGGGLAVQDIFDFLNAWLAGCP